MFVGLCLEKVPMASPSLSNRTADRDQEIITCYEKSGDIALLYLQEVEKVFPNLHSFIHTVFNSVLARQMYIHFVAEDRFAQFCGRGSAIREANLLLSHL